MRKPVRLVTSAVIGLTALSGVLGSPAGAAEHDIARHQPTTSATFGDPATPMTAIALAESGGNTTAAGVGNVEREMKIEDDGRTRS